MSVIIILAVIMMPRANPLTLVMLIRAAAVLGTNRKIHGRRSHIQIVAVAALCFCTHCQPAADSRETDARTGQASLTRPADPWERLFTLLTVIVKQRTDRTALC